MEVDMRSLFKTVTVNAALLTVIALFPAVATSQEVPAPEILTVYGKGYGHGRGMSQYGAQGAALAGLTARQILDFYYPGTSTGTTSGYVRVWTTADTSPGTYVRATSGLRARSLSTNTAWTLPTSSTITSWILAPYGDHQTRLSYYRSSTRSWVLWKTLAGMGQFEGRYEASLVTMVLPNGSTVTYRGRLRTADRPGTDLDTLNVLTMEYYLRGVVPKEAITSWRPAALQAQAVAARTYAASQLRSHNDYDLCDTTACQVYGGYASEVTSATNAVVATANQIRTYGGTPILAQFSSSNGGYTAPGDLPYLIAKADPYDGYPGNGNPNSNWTSSIDSSIAGDQLGVGELEQITILQRNGYGTWGGRVLSAEIRGTTATKTLTGDELRFAIGLKSTWILIGESSTAGR
jgi:stage II sporulation protein D